MSNKLKVAIIIPCYNEEDNILKLYQEIISTKISLDFVIEPVFINDCSTDKTKTILNDI